MEREELSDPQAAQVAAIRSRLKARRRLLGAGRGHAAYRSILLLETGLAVLVTFFFASADYAPGWEWTRFAVPPLLYLALFNLAHTTWEATLRVDEERNSGDR